MGNRGKIGRDAEEAALTLEQEEGKMEAEAEDEVEAGDELLDAEEADIDTDHSKMIPGQKR